MNPQIRVQVSIPAKKTKTVRARRRHVICYQPNCTDGGQARGGIREGRYHVRGRTGQHRTRARSSRRWPRRRRGRRGRRRRKHRQRQMYNSPWGWVASTRAFFGVAHSLRPHPLAAHPSRAMTGPPTACSHLRNRSRASPSHLFQTRSKLRGVGGPDEAAEGETA